MTEQYKSLDDLPRKFTMTEWDSPTLYTVTVKGNKANVTWLGSTTNEDESSRILKNLNNNNWKIITVLDDNPATSNGVGPAGERLNFTLSMLKPFQRVVTESGKNGIVAIKDGKPTAVVNGMWLPYMSPENPSEYGNDIVEVYEPYNWASGALSTEKRGALVWKAGDNKVAKEYEELKAVLRTAHDAHVAAVKARDDFKAKHKIVDKY